ncbi:hypothetical protein J2127_001726 [Methanococcus voltae]|nr:hypothetical protein [Methanococcus voltae]
MMKLFSKVSFETLTELPEEPIVVEWIDGGFRVVK